MTKKIFSETVKKWAATAGITAGSGGLVFLIIAYAVSVGAFTVTGYSGDTLCAGNVSDPCYAFVNFTANEDVFVYPVDYDPYGRNTPMSFSPAVKSWKLQRSWGSGWREIDLTKPCLSTWCGAPANSKDNKYSVAFRKGQSYQLRITAYKENPWDVVKWWGFGAPDPQFLGVEYVKQDGKERYETSKALIEAPQVVSDRGVVDITVQAKNATGNVHVLLGFEKSLVSPSIIRKTTLKNVSSTFTYECKGVLDVAKNQTFDCYVLGVNVNTSKPTNTSLLNGSLTSHNQSHVFIEKYESKTVTEQLAMFEPANVTYNGRSWFVAENLNLSSVVTLQAVFNFAIGSQLKYDVAFMPSTYPVSDAGVISAIGSDDWRILDPFINNSLYHVGNFSNVSLRWHQDINTSTSSVHLTPDNRTFTLPRKFNTTGFKAFYSADNTTLINASLFQNSVEDGYNLTLFNGVTTNVTGKYVDAFQCDGTNDFARMNGSIGITSDDIVTVMYHAKDSTGLVNNDVIWGNSATLGGYATSYFISYQGSGSYCGSTTPATVIETSGSSLVVFCANRTYSSEWSSHVIIYNGVEDDCEWWANTTNMTLTFHTGSCALTAGQAITTGGNNGRFAWCNIDGAYSQYTDILFDNVAVIVGRRPTVEEINIFYESGPAGQYPFLHNFTSSSAVYKSTRLPIAFNASSFFPVWDLNFNGGVVGLNFTCDADEASPSWSGEKNTSNSTSIDCPAVGDSFAYEITLFGNASHSPIFGNLTASFQNDTPLAGVVTNASSINVSLENTALVGLCNGTINYGTNFSYYYDWYRNGTLNTTGLFSGATNNSFTNVENLTVFADEQSWILGCTATNGTINGSQINSTSVFILGNQTLCSGLVDVQFVPNISLFNFTTWTLTAGNVSPTNQTVCSYAYNATGQTGELGVVLNDTHSRIQIKCDDSTNASNAVVLNTTRKLLANVSPANDYLNISCWADYNGLDLFSQNASYELNFTFKVVG